MRGGRSLTAGFAALAMVPLASPGLAQDSPRALSLEAPAMVGGASRRSVALSDKLRLRVETLIAPPGPATMRDHIHRRLAGSMIEYYPVDGEGFHLSAGTHLYAPRRDADAATTLLDHAPGGTGRSAPRPASAQGPGPALGLRNTPAATVGYTGRIDGSTAIGVEMGALKGRSFATTREMSDPGAGRDKAINPMVNLTIGHRF
jgi:hypothetical protein